MWVSHFFIDHHTQSAAASSSHLSPSLETFLWLTGDTSPRDTWAGTTPYQVRWVGGHCLSITRCQSSDLLLQGGVTLKCDSYSRGSSFCLQLDYPRPHPCWVLPLPSSAYPSPLEVFPKRMPLINHSHLNLHLKKYSLKYTSMNVLHTWNSESHLICGLEI